MPTFEIHLITLGKFLTGLAPAIFGALISLNFIAVEASRMNRLVSYFSGVTLANYWGHGLSAYFGQHDFIETSIVFTIGVFGLTTASHIWTEVPKWLKSARIKYLGDDK